MVTGNELVNFEMAKYMHDKLESEIEAAATTKRYGVRWLAGNTAAAGTRLGDAVGMAAGVQIGETVNDNDFDSAYPWNSMRRCNGDWNTTTGLFEVMCYEFDTDGVANTAFKTDGSNGNVWVEIPLLTSWIGILLKIVIICMIGILDWDIIKSALPQKLLEKLNQGGFNKQVDEVNGNEV